ncbi:protein ARABIDILLO 1-like [Trifolium pratense]|uniref:Protein ARABIDILLO 1-like n=1 Tax=Trifolium pratense TaxID=57577 RepID=A0A2K3NGB0_TRIPR|nr:protein ARABIDILLO 1-like [Trifolium pratense]
MSGVLRNVNRSIRQEAAGALWNLSFDDRNREAIAAAGGVQALVALAQSCSNASPGLQERAAGALWGLSVSEANSVKPHSYCTSVEHPGDSENAVTGLSISSSIGP